MNNFHILIITFLFTSYAGAYFHSGITKNIISINEYLQSNSTEIDPNGCVWPPCDDDW